MGADARHRAGDGAAHQPEAVEVLELRIARQPLHNALEKNVRLGSTKLLVKGNHVALQSPDNSGALPLHVACEHHDSPSVIQYLIRLDTSTLDAVDREGNTAFHYACRGAKYDTISLLLEKFDAVSVSKRNAHKKLPIDLLWESNEVLDRESVEYTESVFRLLKAYPEMMMNCTVNLKREHHTTSDDFSSQNGKKRKFDAAREVNRSTARNGISKSLSICS